MGRTLKRRQPFANHLVVRAKCEIRTDVAGRSGIPKITLIPAWSPKYSYLEPPLVLARAIEALVLQWHMSASTSYYMLF